MSRHGFSCNLLIFVLVSMATLFSACSRTFTHLNHRLWMLVPLRNTVYSTDFLSVEMSFEQCICTLVTVLAVFGEISTVRPVYIWITSRVYWIDYWMAMTTDCDLDLEVC